MVAAQLWYGAALVLSAALAALFGEARERRAVLVFAVLAAAWVLARATASAHLAAVGLLILDLAAVAWLAKVAWKAPRNWPAWALAAEAVAAAASLAFLLQLDITPAVYLRGLLIVRMAAVMALAAGTCRKQAAHS